MVQISYGCHLRIVFPIDASVVLMAVEEEGEGAAADVVGAAPEVQRDQLGTATAADRTLRG